MSSVRNRDETEGERSKALPHLPRRKTLRNIQNEIQMNSDDSVHVELYELAFPSNHHCNTMKPSIT